MHQSHKSSPVGIGKVAAVLEAYDEDDGCDHHWEMHQDKGKITWIEVHERIQLTIGTKTCPVECGENQLKPRINAPGKRTLNLFRSMLETEAAKWLG